MWEVILFTTVALCIGWYSRGVFNRNAIKIQQREKPEMMWFNEQKSQWERVTKLQLLVADRVVVEVPVKLVKERE
jgi:hypothetical protein